MHSPRGAGASFVIGGENDSGGFMFQEGFIPQNDVYIGILDNNIIDCLPFFKKEDIVDDEELFDIGNTLKRKVSIRKIKQENITRKLSPTCDKWQTEEFTFEIFSPATGIPDPDTTNYNTLKRAVAPIICARFTVKNIRESNITGIFAIEGLKGVYPLSENCSGPLLGVAGAGGYGICLDASKYQYICKEFADFSPGSAFSRYETGFYRNCDLGGIYFNIESKETVSVEFILGWYCSGSQTRGAFKMPYYYNQYFNSLESVFEYGIKSYDIYEKEALTFQEKFEKLPLSDNRKFIISQAIHSYWASTMLFNDSGRPKYVVNEGTYMMMNTFDLSVDHLFYEVTAQSWTVRNQLDSFRQNYAYYDTIHGNGEYGMPGGVSFTHDQGSYGTFSPFGYSSYEMKNKDGCLSYMSYEQLVNWVLCAAVYIENTNDTVWQQEIQHLVQDCLDSLMNRDNPNPALRDGIMDYDGDRCGKSHEITTYDSLDAGLGQARRSLYLAVKTWAAYLAVARIAKKYNKSVAEKAEHSARTCANTIVQFYNDNLGYIPAILDGVSDSAVIPAVEGLVYPYFFGMQSELFDNKENDKFIKTMRKHLVNVLNINNCLFPDGGWKLSAGSNNTWMSKIFLNLFVAEKILGLRGEDCLGKPLEAAVKWWKINTSRCPGIDQIVWGETYSRGFHYPRSVTSVVFCENPEIFLSEGDSHV